MLFERALRLRWSVQHGWSISSVFTLPSTPCRPGWGLAEGIWFVAAPDGYVDRHWMVVASLNITYSNTINSGIVRWKVVLSSQWCSGQMDVEDITYTSKPGVIGSTRPAPVANDTGNTILTVANDKCRYYHRVSTEWNLQYSADGELLTQSLRHSKGPQTCETFDFDSASL